MSLAIFPTLSTSAVAMMAISFAIPPRVHYLVLRLNQSKAMHVRQHLSMTGVNTASSAAAMNVSLIKLATAPEVPYLVTEAVAPLLVRKSVRRNHPRRTIPVTSTIGSFAITAMRLSARIRATASTTRNSAPVTMVPFFATPSLAQFLVRKRNQSKAMTVHPSLITPVITARFAARTAMATANKATGNYAFQTLPALVMNPP